MVSTSIPSIQEKQRIIHLTEVSAVNYPESADYRYKCQLQVLADDGKPLLQKDLLTRTQPKWLLDLKNKGDCKISMTLFSRKGDITQQWQEVGKVSFATEEVLNGQRSQELEFAVNNWDVAPELKLQARLTQNTSEGATSNLNILNNQTHKITQQYQRRVKDDKPVVEVEIPEAVELLPQEEVIVKDVFNKLRAFKELVMDLFFERLLLEMPELIDTYGDGIDGVRDYFYELFDCCVRELQPQSENIVKESLTGIPPEKGDEFDTVEDYAALFADVGMRPRHWIMARQVWMWMLPSIPYLEEFDKEQIAKGTNSPLYRFFNSHVIVPMVKGIRRYEQALPPAMLERMLNSWEVMGENKRQMGLEFYQILFEKYPFVLPIFGRADMDYLSLHLFQALDFLMLCLKSGNSDDLLSELRQLGKVHSSAGVPSCAYPAISDTMFTLFERHVPNFDAELRQAWQTLFDRVTNVMKLPMINEERKLKKAKQFLEVIAQEQEWEAADFERRWNEIQEEVKATGTYTHSYEELAYGAQLAWRNASKCIARIQWNNMVVRDRRDVTEPDAMYQELLEHLRIGTNGGNIQITMTVFRPKLPKERWGPRVWNSQLVRYAAYEQEDGTILGDPANLGLTKAIIKQGWQPPQPRTPYDVLPIVIEVPGMEPKMYELPPEDVLQVDIEHPTIPEFKSLGFRWYAVPALSNLRLDIGGITYGCLPFNGWYMGTEIARDFMDTWRYDKMEDIAKVLKLDTSSEQTLWRDRVALELNVAVLHSFQKAKVTMVDHQSASRQFLAHDMREKKAGRECPADWGWVVPPQGGSACPVYHHEMRDFFMEPSYHHAANKWEVEDGIDLETFISESTVEEDKKDRIIILYGSETGTAEALARKASRQLQRFHPKVMALDEYDTKTLAEEKLLLVVTSTFGNGEIPGNGQKFLKWLKQQTKGDLTGLNYSVLGIGSTVYEHFCAAGIAVDKALSKAGANCIVPLHKGDEIKGQADTFKTWLGLVSRILGADATSADTSLQSNVELKVSYLDNLDKLEVAVSKDRGIEVPVVANQELLKEVIPGSRSTGFIAFDISQTHLKYETGDHVSVYPCNPTPLVNRLCQRLGINPQTYFTAAYVDEKGNQLEDKPPIPLPSTVEKILSEELDLSLREPFSELLEFMYSTAENSQEKYQLETWLEILKQGEEHPDSITLKKTLTDNFMSVVDLFDEFPSVKIDLSVLIELLPKIKPRLYSISSSPLLHPQQIQITVGVLQVKTDAGKTRQGLCSNYLAAQTPGSKIRISVSTSGFRPPIDPEAVMLMVGPGTGVSPLIAFLQYRQAFLERNPNYEEFPLNPACLYFGCRNQNDFIYKDQLFDWVNQGVLSNLEVALSRMTEEKLYVQNLMEEESEQVWAYLNHPKCHYYVCGDAKMADDVFDVLMAIAKNHGGLSHIEAVDFFDKMKKEGRFNTDVWGVTLNFKKAIKQVQKDNYSKAEKWFNQISENNSVEV